MRIYEEKQAKSRYLLNQRYQNACQQIPELSSIDDAISFSSVDQAKKLLDGDSSALSALKDKIRRLSEKRVFLLQSNGFPVDYLEPSYECSDCQDTGYINNQKCHCFRKSIIDLFYTQSHLRGTLELENFEHFSFDYYSKNYIDKLSGSSARTLIEKAYQEATAFIHDFDTSHGNLLLFGTTGIGKTFLSHCVAREIILSIHSVLYLTATELFDALLSKTLERSEESLFLYEQIQDCDLLIIDDLGTERNTDFIVSQLFVCLNDRIINEKSTIISTNLTLEEIKSNYTERTFSRITNHYKILRLAGDDIRIQKKLMNREEN